MQDERKPQSDKFKDLAREVEADEDEEVFAEHLRRMREKPNPKPARDDD